MRRYSRGERVFAETKELSNNHVQLSFYRFGMAFLAIKTIKTIKTSALLSKIVIDWNSRELGKSVRPVGP
jgi:hypothetical protein